MPLRPHYCFMEPLEDSVLLLLSLRLLYRISARIPATIPSLHAPISSLLAAAINGTLLDTFGGTKKYYNMSWLWWVMDLEKKSPHPAIRAVMEVDMTATLVMRVW